MPIGWRRFASPDGRPYFYNPVSGSTQWEPPILRYEITDEEGMRVCCTAAKHTQQRASPSPPPPPPPFPPSHTTSHPPLPPHTGTAFYYYDPLTRRTSWIEPDNIKGWQQAESTRAPAAAEEMGGGQIASRPSATRSAPGLKRSPSLPLRRQYWPNDDDDVEDDDETYNSDDEDDEGYDVDDEGQSTGQASASVEGGSEEGGGGMAHSLATATLGRQSRRRSGRRTFECITCRSINRRGLPSARRQRRTRRQGRRRAWRVVVVVVVVVAPLPRAQRLSPSPPPLPPPSPPPLHSKHVTATHGVLPVRTRAVSRFLPPPQQPQQPHHS